MTTEELKQQEAERQKKEIEENKKRLEEILPTFEAELKVLCEKYQVAIEAFIIVRDLGIEPAIRIRPMKKPSNPYEVK